MPGACNPGCDIPGCLFEQQEHRATLRTPFDDQHSALHDTIAFLTCLTTNVTVVAISDSNGLHCWPTNSGAQHVFSLGLNHSFTMNWTSGFAYRHHVFWYVRFTNVIYGYNTLRTTWNNIIDYWRCLPSHLSERHTAAASLTCIGCADVSQRCK